jgi:hypothetical protein
MFQAGALITGIHPPERLSFFNVFRTVMISSLRTGQESKPNPNPNPKH